MSICSNRFLSSRCKCRRSSEFLIFNKSFKKILRAYRVSKTIPQSKISSPRSRKSKRQPKRRERQQMTLPEKVQLPQLKVALSTSQRLTRLHLLVHLQIYKSRIWPYKELMSLRLHHHLSKSKYYIKTLLLCKTLN